MDFKSEPSVEDVKETFFEESPYNSGVEDFMAENITFEPTSDIDHVLKSARSCKITVQNGEEKDLIDNNFKVGYDDYLKVGDKKSQVRQNSDREAMIRLLMIGEHKFTVGEQTNQAEKEKVEKSKVMQNRDREEKVMWQECKRESDEEPTQERESGEEPTQERESDEEPKQETQPEKLVEFGNSPVVWIKEPSPERLVNGKKTKYYFMPEGSFDKGSPYKCLMCAYMSKSRWDVKLHFHKVHLKEKLYRCIECDFRQEKWHKVLAHWNRIHNPDREDLLKFVCEACGKKYRHQGELKVHVFVHGESKYPCKYCGKGLKSPYAQKNHETERHENERKPCGMCGKMLAGKAAVKEHERVVHFNERTVDCGFCEKTLKCKRNLQLHMESVHGTVEKAHHCHVCNGKFRVASLLKNHVETVHEKTRLFPCPFCKTVLSNKNRFKLHSKRLHKGSDLPLEFKEQQMKSRINNLCVKVIADK